MQLAFRRGNYGVASLIRKALRLFCPNPGRLITVSHGRSMYGLFYSYFWPIAITCVWGGFLLSHASQIFIYTWLVRLYTRYHRKISRHPIDHWPKWVACFLANQKSKSGLADCRGFSASLHLRRVIHPWVSKYVVTKPYVVEHSCTCINVCRAVQAVHHRHIYGHGCKSNSTIAESVLSVNCSLFLRYGEVPYMTVKIQP